MRRLVLGISIFIFCGIFSSCERDLEVKSKDYPILKTNEVSNINMDGAVFSAVLFSEGNEPITDFGFIWDDGNNEIKYSIRETASLDKFELKLTTDLIEGKTYTCKAYAETKDYTVLGNEVSFLSKGSQEVKIISYYPESGFDGTIIKMTGKNFSKIASYNKIYMEEYEAEVLYVSEDSIVFKIPETRYLGEVSISAEVNGIVKKANSMFTILGPEITQVSSTQGYSGDIVRISGKNFLANGSTVKAGIQDRMGVVLSYSDTEIEFVVPYDKYNLMSEYNGAVFVINNKKWAFNPSYYYRILPSWSEKADPETSWYSDSQAFTCNGKGYVLDYGRNFMNCYDPETNQWQEISSAFIPNQGVRERALAPIDNTVYLAGGNFAGSDTRTAVWKFDFDSNNWEARGDLPFGFLGCTTFELHGKYYLVTDHQEVWLCDFKNEVYTQLNDFPLSLGWDWFGSFVIKDKAYVAMYGRTWEYDELNEGWIEKAANPLYHKWYEGPPPYFSMNDEGYVLIGGREMYRYEADEDRWTVVSGYPGYSGDNSYKLAFVIDGTAYIPCFASSIWGQNGKTYSYRN